MIKIFLDSSDLEAIKEFEPRVQGFTTNPTLMRKAGITDYEKFCKEVLSLVKGKPVSFEVIADDHWDMQRQARIINSWGENIYIKIPITTTEGEHSCVLIDHLLEENIKVNATAVFTERQINSLPDGEMIVSVFAGRIADTGEEPCLFPWCAWPKYQMLWASPREVLNIYQAEAVGADIITCTPELLAKYEKFKGMDLNELSLETVKMFYNDAKEAGYKL